MFIIISLEKFSIDIIMYINFNHIIKYILIGIITAISIKYIPVITLLKNDIIIISIIVSISYALIDIMLPSVKMMRDKPRHLDNY